MPEKKYYAYVDKTEDTSEEVFLEFHCLSHDIGIDWILISKEGFDNTIREIKVPAIQLIANNGRLQEVFYGNRQFGDMESEWYLLTTNEEKIGLSANLFEDENSEGAEVYINKIERLSEDTAKTLDQNTSIDDYEDSSEEEIKKALQDRSGYDAEFIAAYNVGQGNSNAVCTDYGVPLLYFDLGGGCYKNKHTYTNTLRFCFTDNPAIILSHWDTDHYESAKRNTAYQANTWIIPRQQFGPAHKKFFLQLQSNGTILIWPSSLTILSFTFGSIIRCNHPNPKMKNHTGLALVATLSPRNNSIRNVFLPADAAYTYIPGYSTHTCDGLIATHHGAEFDTNNWPVPTPSGKSAIAYSYGNGNSYQHPRQTAVAAHHHTNRKDTLNGHIAFCDFGTCAQACGGRKCDLQVSQIF